MTSTDSCHCAALWRGHCLAIWYGEPSTESTSRVARRILETARARPGRTAYIAVLRDSLLLPGAEVREVWIQLGRDLGDNLNATAAIIEGSGFSASSLRAMVTGLGQAAHTAFPMRAFASIEEAARWVRGRVQSAGGSFGTPFELVEAFAALDAARVHTQP